MCPHDLLGDQPTVARPRVTARPLLARFVVRVVQPADAPPPLQVDPTSPGPMLIGKSSTCQLRLTDPAVSRRHAAVDVVDQRLRIRDLGSTNGTTVNGIQVSEAFLVGGETTQLGGTTLVIDRDVPIEEPTELQLSGFGAMIGCSSAMRRLYPLCRRLAATDVPVIIEGETGVGKELLATALHQASARRGGPFVIFDCGAVAPSLVESELFGHERGAFTGSVGRHRGVFERAHGGVLLIDEIGELPLDLQPKLLRAIDRLEITRLGGARPLATDVRVLAATRRDLDREVQAGRFRDDLFHRLAVARIELPPLRERAGDVSLLARHFWQQLGADPAALPFELLVAWEDYAWPGNVRELRNAVARRHALGDMAGEAWGTAPAGQPDESGANLDTGAAGRRETMAAILTLGLPLGEARRRVVSAFELCYLEHLLEQHGGNVTRAAAAAGLSRRQLQRLKSKLGWGSS